MDIKILMRSLTSAEKLQLYELLTLQLRNDKRLRKHRAEGKITSFRQWIEIHKHRMSTSLINAFESADELCYLSGDDDFNLDKPLLEVEEHKLAEWPGFGSKCLEEYRELRSLG